MDCFVATWGKGVVAIFQQYKLEGKLLYIHTFAKFNNSPKNDGKKNRRDLFCCVRVLSYFRDVWISVVGDSKNEFRSSCLMEMKIICNQKSNFPSICSYFCQVLGQIVDGATIGLAMIEKDHFNSQISGATCPLWAISGWGIRRSSKIFSVVFTTLTFLDTVINDYFNMMHEDFVNIALAGANSDEQLSKSWPFFLLNGEQMSNW